MPVSKAGSATPTASFNMVFGYMNRNYEEEIDLPVGAGQPRSSRGRRRSGSAHAFLPRRQQFVFKVRVPKDWGKKDLIWTLTSHGKTEKAYATLRRSGRSTTSFTSRTAAGPANCTKRTPRRRSRWLARRNERFPSGSRSLSRFWSPTTRTRRHAPRAAAVSASRPRRARPSYHRGRTHSPRPSCGSSPTCVSASPGSFIGGARPRPWSSRRSASRLQPARRRLP